jgi:kynureninase
LTIEAHARDLDAGDSLAAFRDCFYLQPDTIYLYGNSLRLLSKYAEAALLAALGDWKRLGIAGWLQAEPA